MAILTTKPNHEDSEFSIAAGKGREALNSAGSMASHAAAGVGQLATDAAAGVGHHADNVTSRAGAGLEEIGDSINENGPQQGMMGSATRAIGNTVHSGGEYLKNEKLSGMSGDFAKLVQKNPLTTIAVAIGLGWFLSSRFRS
jgi:hypothetical protein